MRSFPCQKLRVILTSGQIYRIFMILSAHESGKPINISHRAYKLWNHRFLKYPTMKFSMCKQKLNDKIMLKGKF